MPIHRAHYLQFKREERGAPTFSKSVYDSMLGCLYWMRVCTNNFLPISWGNDRQEVF